MYKVVYRKRVIKDIPKIKEAGLENNVRSLIDIIRINPYQNPPPYEKLIGELKGAFSRRINVKHRLVYQVLENEGAIKIISIWSHYERT